MQLSFLSPIVQLTIALIILEELFVVSANVSHLLWWLHLIVHILEGDGIEHHGQDQPNQEPNTNPPSVTDREGKDHESNDQARQESTKMSGPIHKGDEAEQPDQYHRTHNASTLFHPNFMSNASL